MQHYINYYKSNSCLDRDITTGVLKVDAKEHFPIFLIPRETNFGLPTKIFTLGGVILAVKVLLGLNICFQKLIGN